MINYFSFSYLLKFKKLSQKFLNSNFFVSKLPLSVN
jgi:hypothetical protein